MTFEEGDSVLYDNKEYIVYTNYGGCIQLKSHPKYKFHHGTTIPKGGKHYKQLRLYLPEILKKL